MKVTVKEQQQPSTDLRFFKSGNNVYVEAMHGDKVLVCLTNGYGQRSYTTDYITPVPAGSTITIEP